MTRLAYRAALALLLAGVAIGLADLTANGHGVPPLLGAVAAGYFSVVVLAYACGAAWHVGRGEACALAHRERQRPSGRRVVPGEVLAEQWARAATEESAYADAMAAVAAEPIPGYTEAPTIGYTAVMSTVTGLVGRFDAAGVGDAAPAPWTPPAAPAGRHAGAAASDPSEWGALEYARPQ